MISLYDATNCLLILLQFAKKLGIYSHLNKFPFYSAIRAAREVTTTTMLVVTLHIALNSEGNTAKISVFP